MQRSPKLRQHWRCNRLKLSVSTTTPVRCCRRIWERWSSILFYLRFLIAAKVSEGKFNINKAARKGPHIPVLIPSQISHVNTNCCCDPETGTSGGEQPSFLSSLDYLEIHWDPNSHGRMTVSCEGAQQVRWCHDSHQHHDARCAEPSTALTREIIHVVWWSTANYY